METGSASTRWLSTAADGLPPTRATRRGEWVVDHAHWAGLPTGATRATIVEPPGPQRSTRTAALEPLASLLARRHADLTVAARPLTDYAHAANQKENP